MSHLPLVLRTESLDSLAGPSSSSSPTPTSSNSILSPDITGFRSRLRGRHDTNSSSSSSGSSDADEEALALKDRGTATPRIQVGMDNRKLPLLPDNQFPLIAKSKSLETHTMNTLLQPIEGEEHKRGRPRGARTMQADEVGSGSLRIASGSGSTSGTKGRRPLPLPPSSNNISPTLNDLCPSTSITISPTLNEPCPSTSTTSSIRSVRPLPTPTKVEEAEQQTPIESRTPTLPYLRAASSSRFEAMPEASTSQKTIEQTFSIPSSSRSVVVQKDPPASPPTFATTPSSLSSKTYSKEETLISSYVRSSQPRTEDLIGPPRSTPREQNPLRVNRDKIVAPVAIKPSASQKQVSAAGPESSSSSGKKNSALEKVSRKTMEIQIDVSPVTPPPFSDLVPRRLLEPPLSLSVDGHGSLELSDQHVKPLRSPPSMPQLRLQPSNPEPGDRFPPAKLVKKSKMREILSAQKGETGMTAERRSKDAETVQEFSKSDPSTTSKRPPPLVSQASHLLASNYTIVNEPETLLPPSPYFHGSMGQSSKSSSLPSSPLPTPNSVHNVSSFSSPKPSPTSLYHFNTPSPTFAATSQGSHDSSMSHRSRCSANDYARLDPSRYTSFPLMSAPPSTTMSRTLPQQLSPQPSSADLRNPSATTKKPRSSFDSPQVMSTKSNLSREETHRTFKLPLSSNKPLPPDPAILSLQRQFDDIMHS
ncbi:hypothetical protein BT69DRAFT_697669 [Atractiella rhizophila]|nr:hypothetical protein BT69DRAFT_697669 [Atractiella rhizophila]